MRTQHICETCHKAFNSVREANRCERSHTHVKLDFRAIHRLTDGQHERISEQLGITRWSFRRRYITGEVKVTKTDVKRLAQILGVDMDKLTH